MKEDGLALEKAVDSGDTDLGTSFPVSHMPLADPLFLQYIMFCYTCKNVYPLVHFFV